MVVVPVNSSTTYVTTALKGLHGNSAEVFQIDGGNNGLFNTDMTLMDSPRITDGTIDTIALPSSSITIVVTDGGDE